MILVIVKEKERATIDIKLKLLNPRYVLLKENIIPLSVLISMHVYASLNSKFCPYENAYV